METTACVAQKEVLEQDPKAEFYAKLKKVYENNDLGGDSIRELLYNICMLEWGPKNRSNDPEFERILPNGYLKPLEPPPTKKRKIAHEIQVGDRIAHKHFPSFAMEVLKIKPCITEPKGGPHKAYKIKDPEGRKDWVCGLEVKLVK